MSASGVFVMTDDTVELAVLRQLGREVSVIYLDMLAE
jgi:hypothetical protein